MGIDVAESKRGLDLVALDHERDVIETQGRLSVERVVTLTIALRPEVVCIDSPSGWSSSGRSRRCERELAAIGIQSYPTGPDPGDHPFYRWMRVGFSIFEGLSAIYPLYRGLEVAGTAAEIFPHATACLLAGELRPADTPKEPFRRSVLRAAGVAEHQLTSLDRVDAALGALTGLIALKHRHTAVGDPDEGMILLPAPQLPDTPLKEHDRPGRTASTSPSRRVPTTVPTHSASGEPPIRWPHTAPPADTR